MEAERFRRVDELFDAALDLNPAERTAFLQGQCGEDPTLHREVERLLRLDALAHSFLAEPVVGEAGLLAQLATETLTIPEPPPTLGATRLGDFRLLQPLASCPRAAVFLARRDEESVRPGDEVVLKVLSPPPISAAEIERRLSALHAALHPLEHPALPCWHSFAFDAGRPFLVLEAVVGTPIDRFCDHLNLPMKKRRHLLDLLEEAVAFLHGEGIAHGGLHPGNILVTADRQVKLLDIGLGVIFAPEIPTDTDMLAHDASALEDLRRRLLAGCPGV